MNPRRYSDESTYKLVYDYNGKFSDSSEHSVDSSLTGELNIVVAIYKGNELIASIKLDPIDFLWNAPAVNQGAQYKNGQKGGIVEMFGWPYADIEKECVHLGQMGWMGVKVFPPQESILDYEHPENGEMNPWYWLYQPVSYKLQSRMGSRA
jgi:alpha-amylase